MRRLAAIAIASGCLLALPSSALASQTLSVEKTGTGTGKVTSSPAGISCDPSCSFSFADGAVVLLSGASGANTAPVAWTGCDSVTIEHKCKVTMSGARTVKASFDLAKRKLTLTKGGTGTVTSSPAGIDCGSVCSAEYDHGTEVTLTGTAGANTEAVKWSGCTSVNGEGKCLVTMTAAKAVSATFTLKKAELKVIPKGSGTGKVTSSPAGIDCGSKCSFVFNEGQTITLTGTPSGETEPVKWSGCDSINAEGKCIVAMSGLREVTAIFNLPSFTLTIAKQGSGTGTVTSSPTGIECPLTCSEGFVKGSTVTLTGTPGLHSEAVKWAGCDTVTIENKCLVAMNQARSVTASFDLEPQYIQYSVSVRLKGTGTGTVTSFPGGIECGQDCSETYVNKTRLTLIATPAPGSVFDYWSGGSCAGTGPCEATIVSSRLITAHFVAIGKRTLTVSKAGTGTGTVQSTPAGIDCGATCSSEVEAGLKITLKATPSPGSAFTGWSGEGCSGTSTCKVTMSEGRNLTATFAKTTPPLQCVVPNLRGKTLARARSALQVAHCALGKVRKPKGARLSALRVRSSSPAAGSALAAGAKVSLRLGRRR